MWIYSLGIPGYLMRVNLWRRAWQSNYSPIPPGQKRVHLLYFLGVIEKFKDAAIKSFGVCDRVCAREDRWGTQCKANLRRNIGEWSPSHACHTVDASVSGASSFRLVVNWAGGGEDVLESLLLSCSSGILQTQKTDSRGLRFGFEEVHSRGL